MEMDKELKQINGFIGTTKYYNVMGANVTDGVHYIMENGYSWIVTDSIVILRMELKKYDFMTVKLKLLLDNKAKMIITDGNDKVLYTQDYNYTDAKKDLTMFYTNNVLMLDSEY